MKSRRLRTGGTGASRDGDGQVPERKNGLPGKPTLGHNHRQCAPQRGQDVTPAGAPPAAAADSSAASRASRSVGAVPSRRRCPSAITFHRYPPTGAARTRMEYFATGSPSRREERKPPGQRRLLNDRTGKGPIAVESEVASQTCDTGLRSAGPRRPQQPSNLSDAAGRRSVVLELHLFFTESLVAPASTA